MWFVKKKDYDPFWLKSIAKLCCLWIVFTLLFSSSVMLILSNDFFYQSKVHIFTNYIDISRLIRLEMFLVEKSGPTTKKSDAWEDVLTESQSNLSPNLYSGEIFYIDKHKKKATTQLSLNLIDVGRTIPQEWFTEAFQSILWQTYVWHTLSRHYMVVGMPTLDEKNQINLDRQVAFLWRVPYYNFSLNWIHVAVLYLLLISVSVIIFFFVFLPYLYAVYEPDSVMIDKGQSRFDQAWRRLRKAQSLLLIIEDD